MQPPQLSKTEKSHPAKEVIYLSDPEEFIKQEQLYIEVRKREGRLYSDKIVRNLPELDSDHPLYREWQIRKKSLQKFLQYLKGNGTSMKILDLGCGNGWMSNQLAEKLDCHIRALDLNHVELKQGVRVFGKKPNLIFQYGDIFNANHPDREFDIVVLASSAQYFSDIKKLVGRLMELLSGNGEIHIMDSPFYQPQEVSAARERTKMYYQKLGIPEMASHYFHHPITELGEFDFKIMYDPNSLFHRLVKILIGYKSPFPWIRIKNPNEC